MKKIFILNNIFLFMVFLLIAYTGKTYAQASSSRFYINNNSTLSNTLYVDAPSGVNIIWFDIKLNYDPSKVTVADPPFHPASAGWHIIANHVDPATGIIRYTASIDPIYGSSALGSLQFRSISAPGTITFGPSIITDSAGNDYSPTPSTFSFTPGSTGGSRALTPTSGPSPTPSPTPVPDTDNGDGTCRTARGVDGVRVEGLGCIPTNPAGFAAKFYSIGLGIIGGVGLLFLIYGGYLITLSNGEPQKVANGRSYIMYAIIGLLFAVFGYVFIQVIVVDVLHVPGFS